MPRSELDALAQRMDRRLTGLERHAQARASCPGPEVTPEKIRGVIRMILEMDERDRRAGSPYRIPLALQLRAKLGLGVDERLTLPSEDETDLSDEGKVE